MLKPFIPDVILHSVYDIPLADLTARGIRGLLFDLDNTLLPHYGQDFDPALMEWIRSTSEAGFKVCIVSNGPPRRTLRLAGQLGVPGIPSSQKPRRVGLRRGLAALGVQPGEAAMIGDQLFTDVWAGNRLGVYTILVDPYGVQEPGFIGVKRWLETAVLRLAGVSRPAG